MISPGALSRIKEKLGRGYIRTQFSSGEVKDLVDTIESQAREIEGLKKELAAVLPSVKEG